MRNVLVVTAAVVVAGALGACGQRGGAATIDAGEVQRKIEALGVQDETVPEQQRPEVWLFERRTRILPQLIAGLDNKNPRVGKAILYKVLRDFPENAELIRALVVRGGDANSPVRQAVLVALEKYASRAEVAKVLESASGDPSAGKPVMRARWAALAGEEGRAVEILRPVFGPKAERSDVIDAIRLLGEIGEPRGLALLEPVARGERWELAAGAYLAMAKIDPARHGLSQAQKDFLSASAHRLKDTN
jgi:hypothetical protein